MAQLDPILEFREDHRKVRDGLLQIIESLKARDVSRASEILGNLNKLLGPHFRYEEEALYPALRIFLGEYVDQLISEHDEVIKTAKSCLELLGKGKLTEQEGEEAAKAARALLVHVSNCDGLSILSERLHKEELEALGNKLLAMREAGVSLLEWAEKIRKK